MEEDNTLTLKEIQQEQAKILKKLADFCKENDLTYYLTGGTLLGAIRHKGFIPWDDDIDVVMPRPDYDRMHQIVKEKKYHIDDNLILRSLQYNNLLLPFSKVMNTSLRMETHFYENEYDNYLWVDVFPMDGLPESDKKINKIYKKIWFLRRLLALVEVKDDIIQNESKKSWMILPKKIARIFLSNKIVITLTINNIKLLIINVIINLFFMFFSTFHIINSQNLKKIFTKI